LGDVTDVSHVVVARDGEPRQRHAVEQGAGMSTVGGVILQCENQEIATTYVR
jgi:hypothetical protein